MEATSLTPQQQKLKALQQLLPEAFAEGKIDWEKLKATLGEDINFSNERYVLNWAGKSDAFKILQTPTTKTLIPVKHESINFDETENIFIEGENLEVLKVLQKSYFGKVKMIYIDPPYNTGNDSFIYPDKFSETLKQYQERVGDKDEEGYMTKGSIYSPSAEGAGFKKNSKENGQYHSNWLNMMMPRLYLAKNLLKQDGVIFVSIDDNEVHNLRLLMNEVFGEENFVGQIVWQTATDNNPTQIATEHEYVLCYIKNKELQDFWEIPSEKGIIIQGVYEELKNNFGNDIVTIQAELRKWIRSQTNGNDLSGISHYSYVDEIGVFYPGNSSNTKDGGYKYDIIHPITNKVCSKPEYGYRFPIDTFTKAVKNGDVLWGNDEKNIPKIKKRLDTVTQKLKSYYYEDNRATTGELKNLFGGNKVFNNPKSLNFLKHIMRFIINKNDLILDFFAGSGTTAHAVMDLNAADGGNRKYICVQMPELCDDKSEAYKAGYQTIAEISKERIRRAGKKIETEIATQKEKKKGQIEFEETKETKIDLGFKVLKLADSNFKQWQQIEGKDAKALTEQMEMFIDPIAENATIENMVYEFLLKSGKNLNSKISHPNSSKVGAYHIVNDGELILLLETVSQNIIEQIIAQKPTKVIALDKLFKDNDQLKTNTVLQMRDAGIEFKTV